MRSKHHSAKKLTKKSKKLIDEHQMANKKDILKMTQIFQKNEIITK